MSCLIKDLFLAAIPTLKFLTATAFPRISSEPFSARTPVFVETVPLLGFAVITAIFSSLRPDPFVILIPFDLELTEMVALICLHGIEVAFDEDRSTEVGSDVVCTLLVIEFETPS